jgi:Uma2 family endonuclease
MNAALFRHAAVHFDVAKYLDTKRSDLRWVVEFDHMIIKGGRSIEYIIDIAGLDLKKKSIEFAVEIAATTQRKDGKQKHSDYELSKIPYYLLVDCISGKCSLFQHNGNSYDEIDVKNHFPELIDIVAKAIVQSAEMED